jgi:hypothetical protein
MRRVASITVIAALAGAARPEWTTPVDGNGYLNAELAVDH